VCTLLADGEITVLLAGAGPDGLAVLRFRPSLWKATLDSYLEELYVLADQRGRGIGRALMEAAIDLARREGAADMSLGTGEEASPRAPSTRASASATGNPTAR
jgi:GNAT superfamily N-acetyltransferase